MRNFFTTSFICLIIFMSASQTNLKAQDNQNQETTQSSVYPGTYEGDRNITQNDSGDLMYQRVGAPMALKMIEIEADLYKMEIPAGVRAPLEIPKIQFIKNENNEITGLYLVYNDGRKDGPYKKIKN